MERKLQFVLCLTYFLITEVSEAVHGNLRKKCSKCSPGWGVAKKCTTNSDTRCVSCIEGKTYSPYRSSKSPCWLCSRCGIGLYESHTCSIVRDTICSECNSYMDRKNLTKSEEFMKKCGYMFLN